MFLLAKASLSIILHSPVEINHLQVKTLQNSSTNMFLDFDMRGHQEINFFTRRPVMDYGVIFGQK